MTDGYSNGQVSGPARKLKNSGVVIFSVGIGQSVSLRELRVMASDPVNQHVITLSNFTELEHLAEQMSTQTCNGRWDGWLLYSGSRGYGHSIRAENVENGVVIVVVYYRQRIAW